MVGRPWMFTPEMAERICDAVGSNAKSLEWICQNNPEFPSARTVWRWQAKDANFCQQMTEAGERRADILFDEVLDIADDTGRDTKLVGRKDAPSSEATEVCNYEWISRSKLRIETRFKMIGMLNRKKYGDKLEVDGRLHIKQSVKDFTEDELERIASGGRAGDTRSPEGAG